MTDGASPFIFKAVDCPICHEAHDQPHFRLRMFLEVDRESDGHVLRYKWLNDRVRSVHPPNYYLYHCPHCYFTDITTEYKNPRENQYHPLVERAIHRLTERDRDTLAFFAKRVDFNDIQFENALALHYLAAYVQLLLPDDTQDYLKIGRLLLRIAWLFREQAPAESGEITNPVRRDALAALGEFEKQVQQLFQHWQKANQALIPQIETADREAPQGSENPFRQHRDRIEKLLEAQVAEVYRLKTHCKTGGAGSSPSETTQDFLASAKSLWPMAPVDEIEAMRMAVGYLENAVSRDATFDDPQTYLNGISLIIDLMIRCGDFDTAFTMMRSIYRNATQARASLQELLRRTDVDEAEKQRARNKMRSLSRSVEHAGEIRRNLLGKLIERDRPVIRRVLAENAGASVIRVTAALEQNGISPGVVAFLKERGDLDPKKTR